MQSQNATQRFSRLHTLLQIQLGDLYKEFDALQAAYLQDQNTELFKAQLWPLVNERPVSAQGPKKTVVTLLRHKFEELKINDQGVEKAVLPISLIGEMPQFAWDPESGLDIFLENAKFKVRAAMFCELLEASAKELGKYGFECAFHQKVRQRKDHYCSGSCPMRCDREYDFLPVDMQEQQLGILLRKVASFTAGTHGAPSPSLISIVLFRRA